MFAFDQKDEGALAKEPLETILNKMGHLFNFYYYYDKTKQYPSANGNALKFQYCFLPHNITSPSELLSHMVKRLKLSKEIVLLAFYYINVLHKQTDYLGKKCDMFAADSRTLLNKFSVHFLLMVSLYRAHKSLSDKVNLLDFSIVTSLAPAWLEARSQDLVELLSADFMIPSMDFMIPSRKEADTFFWRVIKILDADYKAICLPKPSPSVVPPTTGAMSTSSNAVAAGSEQKKVETAPQSKLSSSGAVVIAKLSVAKPTTASQAPAVAIVAQPAATAAKPAVPVASTTVMTTAPAASQPAPPSLASASVLASQKHKHKHKHKHNGVRVIGRRWQRR